MLSVLGGPFVYGTSGKGAGREADVRERFTWARGWRGFGVQEVDDWTEDKEEEEEVRSTFGGEGHGGEGALLDSWEKGKEGRKMIILGVR